MFFGREKFCLIFMTLVLSGGEAENVLMDFPEKCSIKDGECQMRLFTTLLHKYAETGVPELGIPAMDPYNVKNTTVSVLGMVDFIMTDGKVEGITSCSFTKFETDIDKRVANSESVCESIKVEGRYKIEVGPLVQYLTGNSVSGDGIGKIQIDKMTLKTSIPFNIEKHDDGEIYLVPIISDAQYSTNDIEQITFGADNVIFGNREISEPLIKFMNNNWRMILRSFGPFFSDKIMETFYYYLKNFLVEVPANKYISDDLTTLRAKTSGCNYILGNKSTPVL